jgi:1-acyl-sn-glycerol-3-phosphate acyltransferase
MKTFLSLLYWFYISAVAIVLFVGAVVLWLVMTPFDPTRAVLHRYTCWWGTLYLRCLPGCRLEVEGRDKIRPGVAYVLVANHQSIADIMALSALAVPFKWVSKKEVFRMPIVGWNMMLNGYVNVDRGNLRTVAKTMDVCRGWLAKGVPLMMFPEGHRSPDGEMQDFHGGPFKLAVQANCAVVPIVVDGTHGLFRGARVTPPARIDIKVLEPITVAEAGGTAGKLRDVAAERMRQALDDLRKNAAAPQALLA